MSHYYSLHIMFSFLYFMELLSSWFDARSGVVIGFVSSQDCEPCLCLGKDICDLI